MNKALLAIIAVLGVVFALAAAPRVAHAQPAGAPAAAAAPAAGEATPPPPPPAVAGTGTGDRDVTAGNGTSMALLFWAFAFATVGGAVFVITRRNLIAAVMGMVGTFFALAVLYMMLYASFLAILQMLVYAGAIMVLFVFVIMVLNRPEDEPWGIVGLPGKALAGVALLYLLFRATTVLWSVTPPDPKAAAAPPPPVAVVSALPSDGQNPPQQKLEYFEWGSTAAVGNSLFGDYVFPFEAISILLLIAVVGAIAIARPLKDDSMPDTPSPGPGGGAS